MASASPTKENAYLNPSQGDLKYILTVLASIEEKPQIDWKALAPLLGVKRWDNAQSKFRDIGRRLNWKCYGGTGPSGVLSPTKDDSPAKLPETPTTSKKTVKTKGTATSALKRKATGLDTPTPVRVKRECITIDDDDDEENIPAVATPTGPHFQPTTPRTAQNYTHLSPLKPSTPSLTTTLPFPVLTPPGKSRTPRTAARLGQLTTSMMVRDEFVDSNDLFAPPKMGALFGDGEKENVGGGGGGGGGWREKEDSCDEDGNYDEDA